MLPSDVSDDDVETLRSIVGDDLPESTLRALLLRYDAEYVSAGLPSTQHPHPLGELSPWPLIFVPCKAPPPDPTMPNNPPPGPQSPQGLK